MAMSRSRAAILPYPCDPFLGNYWLSFYDGVWKHEVDKLYIYANSTASSDIMEYIYGRFIRSENVHFVSTNTPVEHGECINRILGKVTEDYVVLLEDDCFIFKRGYLSQAFNRLELGEYDIVGSKRLSCSTEISDRALKLWDLSYAGYGDQGCNFWPNLFFARTQILKDSSRNFGAKHWNAGEYYAPLDYTFTQEAAGDTFVSMSLELRAKKYRIGYIPQYHCNIDDYNDWDNNRGIFDGHAPWVHAGSLSTGAGGLIRDAYNRPILNQHLPRGDKVVLGNPPQTEMEKMEYERRVAFWMMAWEAREAGKIEPAAVDYYTGLRRIIADFGLSDNRIRQKIKVYRKLGL